MRILVILGFALYVIGIQEMEMISYNYIIHIIPVINCDLMTAIVSYLTIDQKSVFWRDQISCYSGINALGIQWILIDGNKDINEW